MDFIYLPQFVKRLKQLNKKYPSLKQDLQGLLQELYRQPITGVPLGADCYKIRLAIKSKSSGKSAGARIITCGKIEAEKVYYLTMHDNADQSSITDEFLQALIKSIR